MKKHSATKEGKAGKAPGKAAARTKVQTPAEEQQTAISQRDRIAGSYGHSKPNGHSKPDGGKKVTGTEKDLASPEGTGVDLVSDITAPAPGQPEAVPQQPVTAQEKDSNMATLTLKGLSKSGKYALYGGLRTVSRLSVTNFTDNKPPQTLEVTGEQLAGPREQLTKEQRKELRKNAPKPTLAERIEQRRKALAKLEEKAAKEAAAPAA